jgi:hypothetical protein
MSRLLDDLNAFLQEHRRCGKMDGGVEDERVWMTCNGCGAGLSRSILCSDNLPVIRRASSGRQRHRPERKN